MIFKVAFMFGSLNRGGTETLLLDVLRHASQENIESIAIYRKSGSLENQFLSSGVKMYLLQPKNNIISYLMKLRKLLSMNNVNIVHAQQPIDALFAFLATITTNVKVIQTLHGFDYNEKFLSRVILSFIIKRTDKNVFVSKTQRDYYIKKYKLNPEKQVVIYNGIDLMKFQIKGDYSIREELGIDSQTLLLGSVGSFNTGRNQMLICKALKLLANEGVKFHFVFIGKRIPSVVALYDECISYCERNNLKSVVSFLGAREDVPQLLDQLDAFVYSTVHDTFGIAVIEAMASGVPVIVNDWDVMKEITQNGKYANIYVTNDEYDLFEKVVVLFNDNLKHTEKSRIANIHVIENYSIENHIRNLRKLYKKVIGI